MYVYSNSIIDGDEDGRVILVVAAICVVYVYVLYVDMYVYGFLGSSKTDDCSSQYILSSKQGVTE